jgi:hypothetical protein
VAVGLWLPSGPSLAAELELPPGFTSQVYVTGHGFDRGGEGAGAGIPVMLTLGVDGAGALYLARSGNRYGSSQSEDVLAWQSWLDARNQCLAARLIAASALARQESRGAHYRADHPARDDAGWLVSVRIARRGGEPAVWTEPVRLHRLRPGATPAPATVEIGD